MNGDGKTDIIVGDASSCYGCSGSGAVGVLLGNGDGTFQPVFTYNSGGYSYETGPTALALADLDSDGKLDIVVTNYCFNACTNPTAEGNVSVLLGNGDGTFQPAISYGSGGFGLSIGALAVGDVNGDGKPDLLVVNGNCSYGSCEQGTLRCCECRLLSFGRDLSRRRKQRGQHVPNPKPASHANHQRRRAHFVAKPL